MEFTGDGVRIDKQPSDLDSLVLDVRAVLDDVGVEYAAVSGYVVVLFGRARATEDIDVLMEQLDESRAIYLADHLHDAGFWGPAMPLDDMYETLSDGLPIRVAQNGHRVPNVELKFATDEYDRISLRERLPVRLGDETIQVGSLELQVAYKLHMGTQKDFEDALYLFEVVEPMLNKTELEAYVDELGVEDAYDRLRRT